MIGDYRRSSAVMDYDDNLTLKFCIWCDIYTEICAHVVRYELEM